MANRQQRVKNAVSTARTAPKLALLGTLSLHISGGWEEQPCTAGRTGTQKHFFLSVSTPDSLFHTCSFLGIFAVTTMCRSVARSSQIAFTYLVEEFLVVSRTKILPTSAWPHEAKPYQIWGATKGLCTKSSPTCSQRDLRQLRIQTEVCSLTGLGSPFLISFSFTFQN